MPKVQYETERLRLVASKPWLAEAVASYYTRNKEFLREVEPEREPEFFTGSHQRKELAADDKDIKAGTAFRLWLLPKGEDKVIGLVALNQIVRGPFQSALLAYKLDAEKTGQGLMREALQKLIEVAFGELKLHRIEANIMPRNTPSLHLVEQLGFQNEGLAKHYLKINGVWEDHIHMTLLNEPI